jgi:lauroyl/myristoyl acyltransferase
MARILQALFRSMIKPPTLETVTGKIAVVQEERFRLITDEGQGLILTLSHSASVTPEQLWDFHRRGLRVLVEYHGTPSMETGVATAVREM